MTTIHIEHVSLRYPDGFQALRDVSLDVDHGQILGLLGSSGSGKSTLLRAIAGLEPIAQGRITVGGQDMDGVPPHRRNVGMVFQDGQLFPHRNVERNIAYGLEMAGVKRSERQARVAHMLDVVGLAGFEKREVGTLSGGQAQRVALARSLAARPQVLLLDEPLSALDKELRQRLAVDVRQILKAAQMTAIFVTHDPDEATSVADRVLRMADGTIVQ
ncbi:ABC transporter ATP-binding protein [Arcanobacterium pinnipediorum]|uniref:ABC transporter ATP-binding protein n=1 Tax=Arcanobacterium pinnipediorum TaxID=1503041 RepID=A0ABY5AJU9_9ACTO|nr:ABC transporter ATP-binding protein [Arcanobacterium pinnipediorum]USR79544.1 ABC transporter ATP-binding protein [Arcanobacterium pinnipediorum]